MPGKLKRMLFVAGVSACVLAPVFPRSLRAEQVTPAEAHSSPQQPSAASLLGQTLARWADLIEPADGTASTQTFTAQLKVTRGIGLPRAAQGATLDLAYQAPDHLRVSGEIDHRHIVAGRDSQQLWVHMPDKAFGVVGSPDVPRFKAYPDSKSSAAIAPFSLPISREQLALAIFAVRAKLAPAEVIDGATCNVLDLSLLPAAAQLLGLHDRELPTARLWIRQDDMLPARIAFAEGKTYDVQIEFTHPQLTKAWTPEQWRLAPNAGDKIETVAVSHLVRFINAVPGIINQKIPTLGPATGVRTLVATEGAGRLEMIDGTRVLFLKGTPEEMGHQHGVLLKPEIRDVMDKILYGIGVGSSFERGNWFFGEIEGAEARMEPFIDPRYIREMDSLASAIGAHPAEARLSNFFPELFHCSGFAIYGKASGDGHLYHGRVLDYMKGVGLEQSAVVIVHQPDDHRNAWVNLSYAGFVGSVTAMNEKGIAMGEMGGKGYGKWDGKPMAELMRDVMEHANTLDEAVAIMKKGPRTCEYYYVISSGKEMKAVGVAATPDLLTVIGAGEFNERLPHPVEDAVLLSAGDRYETLVKRVQSNFGNFDPHSARDLMTRPVCMTSNIQSVLFRPDTLDLWVANADGKNVASATRFTQYNLKELLASEAPKETAAAQN